MDINNKIIKLCIDGSKAEFSKDLAGAKKFYKQAWAEHRDNYEGCIAAHYLARVQGDAEGIFYWNKKALDLAALSDNDEIKGFYPSLYVNMGHSYERLGDKAGAGKYYELASKLGISHY